MARTKAVPVHLRKEDVEIIRSLPTTWSDHAIVVAALKIGLRVLASDENPSSTVEQVYPRARETRARRKRLQEAVTK
jgi:hypothetical protein